MSLRVAVLGASGFGRHHAKWYASLGCEVVAFLGSSPATVAATERALREAIGFAGRGYTSLDKLLGSEQCDAVSVCTPWPLHGEQSLACIEAGCSVLCEKPMVWRPGATPDALLAEARQIAEAAERRGVVLSVNTQYAAAAEAYRSFLPEALATRDSFSGVMTSQIKPHGPRGRDIWLDLAPHSLSILLCLLPDGELQLGSVSGSIEPESVRAAFTVAAGDRTCRAEIHVAKLHEPPFPRRFGFGEWVVECGSAPDASGVYRGFLRLGDREFACDDFMKTSIGSFCAAVRGEGEPLVRAAAALRDLELMLVVLDELERAKATF